MIFAACVFPTNVSAGLLLPDDGNLFDIFCREGPEDDEADEVDQAAAMMAAMVATRCRRGRSRAWWTSQAVPAIAAPARKSFPM